jgi:large subunit ribosomal protein L6
MSRIGNKAIEIPAGVTVTVSATEIVVKGPKGELKVNLMPGIAIATADNKVVVSRSNDERQTRAYHGLIRSLLNNCIIGVTQGYEKTLKLIGTGYRVAAKGTGLNLSLGFSHQIEVQPDAGITLAVEGQDTIFVRGIDKHAVGQQAANIRKLRPPEVYKGKGIRYTDEVVRKKAGKTAAK